MLDKFELDWGDIGTQGLKRTVNKRDVSLQFPVTRQRQPLLGEESSGGFTRVLRPTLAGRCEVHSRL